MIRVAVVVDSLKVGGAQRLVSAFASNAAPYGILPVIVTLNRARASVISESIRTAGVKVITLHASSLFDLRRLRRLIKLFRDEQIDLVQTHLMYANILGTLAARIARVPVIATLHSTDVTFGWKPRILKRLEDNFLRRFATRILAVGNTVAETHEGCYGDRKVNVIPNGIPRPEPIQSQARNRLRKEIAGDERSSIIITVGRFTRAKGYEDMIKAFSLLRDKTSKPVLLMVGAGSTAKSIKQRIETLHLSQSVILTGERSDVPQLLASSDVYASSSHREGLPLAVLEAMMAGLPVVATSVGDIPNVVTEETGVIVPPHQPKKLAAALENLLKNPKKREAMGKAAQQRAIDEYSVEAWMKKHLAFYREVLGASGRDSSS